MPWILFFFSDDSLVFDPINIQVTDHLYFTVKRREDADPKLQELGYYN